MLSLPETVRGRGPVTDKQLRPISATPNWTKQREHWMALIWDSGLQLRLAKSVLFVKIAVGSVPSTTKIPRTLAIKGSWDDAAGGRDANSNR